MQRYEAGYDSARSVECQGWLFVRPRLTVTILSWAECHLTARWRAPSRAGSSAGGGESQSQRRERRKVPGEGRESSTKWRLSARPVRLAGLVVKGGEVRPGPGLGLQEVAGGTLQVRGLTLNTSPPPLSPSSPPGSSVSLTNLLDNSARLVLVSAVSSVLKMTTRLSISYFI